MNHERFKKVEEIYHAVLKVSPEKRDFLLEESCGSDVELRREVESLISYDNTFNSVIDTPPESLVAEMFAGSKKTSIIGTQINQYQIISLLGKGGMGEVYLAFDSKLERKVALKLLSEEFAENPNRLRRFFQEAKSASALNHPNILTVHEISELDDRNFIVTEFIKGKTLKHYLSEEKPALRATLEIAEQIVSALAAAHEAHIVHRDIKPDNIMVRKDGIVKVLDFGLAKLSESQKTVELNPEAATQMKEMTAAGMILGTPQYMSPEQARAQKVDSRTDIFSFGIVLYEMITGKTPFSGVNDLDIIGSILKEEPKLLSEHLPEISPDLEKLVGKALRKDPEKRYQHIKDLYVDLRDVKNSTEPNTELLHKTNLHTAAQRTRPTTSGIVNQRRFSLIHALGFLIFAAIVFTAIWWFIPKQSGIKTESVLKSEEVVNWASSPGEIYSVGSFSPDAKMVAFASTKSGSQNIWIKQTSSGESVQITKDEFSNKYPIWSPNGEELAFFSTRGNKPGIWRTPILGGSPTLVAALSDAASLPRFWSKTNVIYFESRNDLFSADVNSGEVKPITDFKTKSINPRSISISHDEEKIVYVTVEDKFWRVWTKNLKEDAPQQLVESTTEIRNTAWHPDNRRVFYNSKTDDTFQIFVTDTDGAKPEKVSSGERDNLVLDVSQDGTKILYGSAKEESDLWGVNLKDKKEFTAASEIDSELWANVSPDGRTIAYQSIKNLSQGNKLFNGTIFTKSSNGSGQPTKLVAEGFLPIWSPDGQKVAYMKVVGEKNQIETVQTTGSGQKVLVGEITPISYSLLPYNRLQTAFFSWSPDSSRIAYVSERNGQQNIRLVNADGTNDLQLSENTDSNLKLQCPLWSPDGKKMAFTTKTDNTSGKTVFSVWLIDVAAKNSKQLTQQDKFFRLSGWMTSGELMIASIDGSSISTKATEVLLSGVQAETGKMREIAKLKETYLYNIHLSKDAKQIAFAAHRDGKDNIWLMSANDSEARQITNNNDARIYFSSLAWSADNSSMFFGKQSRYSLLSMLTNFK